MIVIAGAIVSAVCESPAPPLAILRGALIAYVAVSAVTDIGTGYVFDRVSLAAALAFIILAGVVGDFAGACFGAILTSLPFALIHVVTRGRGMGFGDVKLAAAAGLGIGASGAFLLIATSFIIGSLWSIGAFAAGRARLGEPIPFAPFLASGVALTLILPGSESWLIG